MQALLKNSTKWLYLAVILTIPLLTPMIVNVGYEEVKVLIFLRVVLGLAFIFALTISITKTKLRFHSIYYVCFILLVTMLVTSVAGVNVSQSFFGVRPYLQGIITFLFLAIFSLLLYFQGISSQLIKRTIILSTALVSVVAIFQYFQLQTGALVPTYAGRVVSTFGQPNFYAGFLLITMPFLLEQITQSKRIEKIFFLATLALNSAGIAISFSRTAIILAALVLSIWLIRNVIKTKILKLIMTGILVTGLFYALIPSRILEDELIQPFRNQTVEFSNVQKRFFIWQIAIEQIGKRPLLGYGLENIDEALPSDYDFNHPKPAFYHSIKDLTIDNTHNLFLNLLLWGGVVVFISFIFLLAILYKSTKSLTLKVSLTIFLVWSFFQNLSLVHWLFFYILIAMIAVEANKSIDATIKKKVQLTEK